MRAFKLFLLNLQNELPKHRQMIRIGSYMFFIVLSFFAFIITTINYFNNPLIEDLSANQYYIAPFIVGFLGAAIVLVFGFFSLRMLFFLYHQRKFVFLMLRLNLIRMKLPRKRQVRRSITYLKSSNLIDMP